ncbi:DUF3592 domain-containing protein [Kitasatospora sp. NPDC056808]
MAKKKKNRRGEDWTPPPKSAERLAAEGRWARDAELARLPPVPPRRAILGMFAMGVVALAVFLGFLLPSQFTVDDLRSSGVTVAAEVVDTRTNKYGDLSAVEVRFRTPSGEVEAELHDWGGKQPEGLSPGSTVSVTYSPQDPKTVMTTGWVVDPPGMTFPALVCLLVTVFLTVVPTLAAVRRFVLLKKKEKIVASHEA